MCFFFLSAQANSLSNEVTCRCVSETRLAQNKKLHLFFSLFVYFFFYPTVFDATESGVLGNRARGFRALRDGQTGRHNSDMFPTLVRHVSGVCPTRAAAKRTSLYGGAGCSWPPTFYLSRTLQSAVLYNLAKQNMKRHRPTGTRCALKVRRVVAKWRHRITRTSELRETIKLTLPLARRAKP